MSQDSEIYLYTHFGSKLQPKRATSYTPNINLHIKQQIYLNSYTSKTYLSTTLNISGIHERLDDQLIWQRKNEHLLSNDLSTHDVHQFVSLRTNFENVVGSNSKQEMWQEFEMQPNPLYQKVTRTPGKPKRLLDYNSTGMKTSWILYKKRTIFTDLSCCMTV